MAVLGGLEKGAEMGGRGRGTGVVEQPLPDIPPPAPTSLLPSLHAFLTA